LVWWGWLGLGVWWWLPEVQTQGGSLEQAREMVRDAIELVLEDRRARNEQIPRTGWAVVESVEVAA
jgi:predicted RNase H-like HicB family nuclease